MRDYIDVIVGSELMKDITKEEALLVLSCLRAKQTFYKKKSVIMREGQKMSYIGIVLAGKVNIIKSDFYGNKNIIMSVTVSGIFGQSVVFSAQKTLPFNVEAESDCIILSIDPKSLSAPCNKSCSFHIKLISNLLNALANKVVNLTKKVDILSMRSTKEKILELLRLEKNKGEGEIITLSMTRQEMADYLSVDRSALSRELTRLKEEGIIDYYLNEFRIMD